MDEPRAFSAWKKTIMTKKTVGGGRRGGAGRKQDHFDVAFADIHNA